MPTYEYLCENCGYRFERFQSISADPVKVCPECHAVSVKRLIGGGNGFLFKGSGFYITDYRRPGYEQAKKAEAGGTNGTTSSKSESTSTKTATTKD